MSSIAWGASSIIIVSVPFAKVSLAMVLCKNVDYYSVMWGSSIFIA